MYGISRKRWRIYQRDGWRCHYCRLEVLLDVPQSHARFATFDHKHPRSKGGRDDDSNIVTCCARCNKEKADIPYEMYRWFRHMRLLGHCRQELLDAIAAVEEETELAPVAQPVEARP